jgi:hypothetical protein
MFALGHYAISDASWAIEKAKAAYSGVTALLAASPSERFS